MSALTLHTAGAAAPETVNLDLGKPRMALENNSDVKISAAELDAAKAQKDQAEGARWGTVSFNHYSGRGGQYQTTTGRPHFANSHTNEVSISVPIYSGGSLEGAIDQSRKT